MISKKRCQLPIVLALGLLIALGSSAGASSTKTSYVTGLECAYMGTPGQQVIHGQTMQVANQGAQNLFLSDDPSTFPNGQVTGYVDYTVNMVTGKYTIFATAVIQPEGVAGAWEGHGVLQMDSLNGTGKGHGVYHGTGVFADQTMVMHVTPGDPVLCPPSPMFITAWRLEALIAPTEP